MIPLLEVAIGFVAIMLVLSMLVKSLTSLVKNYIDYYFDNIQYEIDRLTNDTVGFTLSALKAMPGVRAAAPWVMNLDWRRVGEQFLTRDNITWVLKSLGATDASLENLEARLAVHKANLKYAFDQRMKNLALAAGLALCLGLNVNALTIWHTLYVDGQTRATFATSYADKALAMVTTREDTSPTPPGKPAPAKTQSQQKQELDEKTKSFKSDVQGFLADVQFGVGRLWKEQLDWFQVGYEFLGSLLTGILVSIGAPYWHDLLRSLSSLRTRGRGAT